jgi:hypothetical protein
MWGFDRISWGFAKNEIGEKSPVVSHTRETPQRARGVAMESGCPPCEETLDLEEEYRLLDALPVVNTMRDDTVTEKTAQKRRTGRVIPSVKLNQSSVPTVEHAVRALRLKIVKAHAGCLAAAEAARAEQQGPTTRPPPNAFVTMMAQASAIRADRRAAAAEDFAEAARKEAAALRAAAEQEWSQL